MKVEEIQCSNCQINEDEEVNNRSRSISPIGDKLAVAQCLDCEHHYCADCLVEHHIDTAKSEHRLVSLIKGGSDAQETAEQVPKEINNNDIMFKLSKMSAESTSSPPSPESAESADDVAALNAAAAQMAVQMVAAIRLTDQQKQQQQSEFISVRSIEALKQLIEMKQNAINPRLVQIEVEINKTYEFYEQTLKERKEYLLKEMNTITQYALLNHTQNINKQVQIQYQLDMKKQDVEKELTINYEIYQQYTKQLEQLRIELSSGSSSSSDEGSCKEGDDEKETQQQQLSASICMLNEMIAKIEMDIKTKLGLLKELNNLLGINNQLIEKYKSTDPLASIEFISNYSAIQTSIRNTFGYIRINQQQQQQPTQATTAAAAPSTQNTASQLKQVNQLSLLQQLIGSKPSSLQSELNVACDLKLLNNNGTSDILSSNSQSSLLTTGPLSSNSQSSYTAEQAALIQSPISYKSTGDRQLLTHADAFADDVSTSQAVATSSSTVADTIKSVLSSNAVAQYLSALQLHSNAATVAAAATASASSGNDSTDLINQSLLAGNNEQLVQLSAGSTSSNKSTKSIASNASSKSSSTSSSSSTAAVSTTALAAASSKHPLSHLYANFINSNPKLNTFNYLVSTAANDEDTSSHHSHLGGTHNSKLGKYGSSKSSHLSSIIGAGGSSATAAGMSSPLILGSSSSKSHHHQSAQFQINRSKMIYHCKFGEFGINDGQFTEPSGVTINTNNDIIVADTNSHRIQIFDKEGNFKFKFGECGKRDGQLLYPNRVSIVKQTGDIVVTERSPTHQIQIYNKYGQFVRKFGANILQHPRGVYVDYKARIVVVECKVMRVIIFDLYGNVLNKFSCSKYLEFPNGVCCSNPTNPGSNQREEIYISDNRAHCIKVFDYNGNFLRQIGGEGITNYPIGVGINANNEILVADNHNNFNLTVFTQEGKLINALESKVKHAQCFDVGLMDDGSIVLASKDYRIYVYKYTNSLDHLMNTSSAAATIADQQQPSIQLFSPTSSTSSNSSSLSSSGSKANPFFNTTTTAGSSSSLPFASYDLFSDTGNHNRLFPSDLANLSSNASMFSFLGGSGAIAHDHLINDADLGGLVPFFGPSSSGANFESSDLCIEDKSATNLNTSSSNLNQSFSNLFTSNNKSSNLVSMLNGFL